MGHKDKGKYRDSSNPLETRDGRRFHRGSFHPFGLADHDRSLQKLSIQKSHLLSQAAPIVVDYIDDYFTLIRCAQACRALHAAVCGRNAQTRRLFELIEVSRHAIDTAYYVPITPSDHSSSFCAMLDRDVRSLGPGLDDWNQALRRLTRRYQNCMIETLSTFDLVRWGGWFERIRTQSFLPCYGCWTIKSAQYFFDCYKTGHHGLLGCSAKTRRCADCAFREHAVLSESEQQQLSGILGDQTRFLIDMPKGFPGYRELCQHCGTIRWAPTRPLKSRLQRRVCQTCYDEGHQDLLRTRENTRKKRGSPSGSDSSPAPYQLVGTLESQTEQMMQSHAIGFDILVGDEQDQMSESELRG